ncbi:hypothetical protein A8926_1781 [Saccharopolyspora spinosa]|uniref:Uncharacterized protein n=1 Tax=Saccharopolyspora spinosa TaxID=60894 RepID=A0A2N3XU51_SACSN|nr:hypothetical protein A8926_1781 [Saccharopolyspora spinosa]
MVVEELLLEADELDSDDELLPFDSDDELLPFDEEELLLVELDDEFDDRLSVR